MEPGNARLHAQKYNKLSMVADLYRLNDTKLLALLYFGTDVGQLDIDNISEFSLQPVVPSQRAAVQTIDFIAAASREALYVHKPEQNLKCRL